MESKTVLDSEFHAVDFGFQVPHSSLGLWNLDSGLQTLVGFQIPLAKFTRIPDPRTKNFPYSGIQSPLHGAISFIERFKVIC